MTLPSNYVWVCVPRSVIELTAVNPALQSTTTVERPAVIPLIVPLVQPEAAQPAAAASNDNGQRYGRRLYTEQEQKEYWDRKDREYLERKSQPRRQYRRRD